LVGILEIYSYNGGVVKNKIKTKQQKEIKNE
jgi:hypothetical protein